MIVMQGLVFLEFFRYIVLAHQCKMGQSMERGVFNQLLKAHPTFNLLLPIITNATHAGVATSKNIAKGREASRRDTEKQMRGQEQTVTAWKIEASPKILLIL